MSDKNKEVAEAYGVLGVGGFLAKRKSFIINKDGRIVKVFGKVKPDTHSEEVLSFLKTMK